MFYQLLDPFSSVQSISRVQLFATAWTAACQASLSITNSQSLLKLMSIMLVMPSNHLILCCPLLLLPPIPPSIRVFSNESTLRIRWPKYWSFSFSISPSNEHPWLISFRMDWLDLLAVQGTLKSLLQYHSSKASILQCSAFFTAQLSHPYMTSGKTIALTRWIFVGKVMSLLFNMLTGSLSIFYISNFTYQIYIKLNITGAHTALGKKRWISSLLGGIGLNVLSEGRQKAMVFSEAGPWKEVYIQRKMMEGSFRPVVHPLKSLKSKRVSQSVVSDSVWAHGL